MDSTYTPTTKELNGNAIEATVLAASLAEFTFAIGKHASTFKSYELLEEQVTLWPP